MKLNSAHLHDESNANGLLLSRAMSSSRAAWLFTPLCGGVAVVGIEEDRVREREEKNPKKKKKSKCFCDFRRSIHL